MIRGHRLPVFFNFIKTHPQEIDGDFGVPYSIAKPSVMRGLNVD
jgi:hypothetical protein